MFTLVTIVFVHLQVLPSNKGPNSKTNGTRAARTTLGTLG
jgi:hypothetical protein